MRRRWSSVSYESVNNFTDAALLLVEPPSIDAGEITDKGYINQRAVLETRASLVEALYTNAPQENVIRL